MRFAYADSFLPDEGPTSAGLTWTLSNGGIEGEAGSGVIDFPLRDTFTSIREPGRDLPILAEVDVLVCGGGPAGTGAAVGAAKAGAKTLLIERHGFLGGMATAGLVVPHFNPHHNGGLNTEMIAHLTERGAWGAEYFKISFDPEIWKHVSERLVLASGSDILFHTFAVAALMEGNRLRGAVVETKSGRFAILAKVVVDCTGDGDVAARAGATFEKGRPQDGLMQPMTMMFRLSGVNWVQTPKKTMWDIVQDAIERTGHHFRLPYEYPHAIHLPNPGEVAVQLVHVRRVDGTNVRDLTRAEIEGRRQTLAVFDFLQEHVKEFSEARLVETATQIGVRETRRIMGDYVLTAKDVLNGQSFEDTVATVTFPMDIHDPSGLGHMEGDTNDLGLDGSGGRRGMYDIPFRCLLPRGLEQILVAGRCISGTFEAHASYRVKGPCVAMGQAAGAAAALSATKDIPVRDVPIDDLRLYLSEQGFTIGSNLSRSEVAEGILGEDTYKPRRAMPKRRSVYRGPG